MKHSTPEAAFAARTEWRGDCLEWTGAPTGKGYGALRVNGTSVLAHRYAYEQAYGEIPDGRMVDHACHNRLCVRKEHLRLATRSQNGQNRRGPTSRSTTGARNVQLYKGRWRTRVRHAGRLYGGEHGTKEEAMAEAEALRIKLFGEFAGGA